MSAIITRPTALRVKVDGVPRTLRTIRRWVCWHYLLRDGRWAKVPVEPSGRPAKPNTAATWTTFEAVVAAYRTGKFDGIGFVLGDGWAGIDLDKCVADYDPRTGTLRAATDAVGPYITALDQSGAYWELSPSGTGYKAIGRGPRIGGEIKFATDPPTFTRWDGARFFAVTGHYQTPDATADISDLIELWFPAPPPVDFSSARDGYSLAAESTDDDLLMAAISSANGEDFLALWRGDTSAYGDDHSRADMALCGHLAFWTNYDPERIDRLFRQSGLMRAKWNTASYRRATLGKALR